MEVYSYYKGEKGGDDVDKGTKLRFIQYCHNNNDISGSGKNHDKDKDDDKKENSFICLPGIIPVDATFDQTCMEAYCDHWVSNGKYIHIQ